MITAKFSVTHGTYRLVGKTDIQIVIAYLENAIKKKGYGTEQKHEFTWESKEGFLGKEWMLFPKEECPLVRGTRFCKGQSKEHSRNLEKVSVAGWGWGREEKRRERAELEGCRVRTRRGEKPGKDSTRGEEDSKRKETHLKQG